MGLAAGIGVQAGVVRAGGQAPGVQVISQFLSFPAGKAVDDGGLLALFLQQGQQRAPGVAFGHYGVAEVGPVKARQENPPLLQIQLADDIIPHPFRSGGGEGNDRRLGKVPPQGAQVAVIGAELMPPFGNAVGFVNGDEAQFQMFQKVAETRQRQPFRGYIENLDFAPGRGGLHPVNFRQGQRAVDEPGGDAVGVQGVHLVFHQGNQGGNHQGNAGEKQRRQLVAQGFAAAGGHQHQAVAAGQGMADNFLLQRPESGIAKVGFKQVQRGGGVHQGRNLLGGMGVGRLKLVIQDYIPSTLDL